MDSTQKKERKAAIERERIKNLKRNPDKHREWKQKQCDKYQRRKEEGKIKLVKNMTPEEKETQRLKVKERVQKYRQKKKVLTATLTCVQISDKSDSVKEIDVSANELDLSTSSTCDSVSDSRFNVNEMDLYPTITCESLSDASLSVNEMDWSTSSTCDSVSDTRFSVNEDLSASITTESVCDFSVTVNETDLSTSSTCDNISDSRFSSNKMELTASITCESVCDTSFTVNEMNWSTSSTCDSISDTRFSVNEMDLSASISSESVFNSSVTSNERKDLVVLHSQMMPFVTPPIICDTNTLELHCDQEFLDEIGLKTNCEITKGIEELSDKTFIESLEASDCEQTLNKNKESKRHKVKDCQKEDCVDCSQQKAKDHTSYMRRRSKKVISSFNSMSKNQLEANKRYCNLIAVRKYRAKKRLFTESTTETPAKQSRQTESRQKLQAMKKKKEEEKLLKLKNQLKYLKAENIRLHKSKEKYRKRSAREKEKMVLRRYSPRKSVKQFVKNRIIPPDVQEKLVQGEVLKAQLNSKYQSLRSNKQKRLFTSVTRGEMLKKYGLLKSHSSMMLSSKSKPFKVNQSMEETDKNKNWRALRKQQRAECVRKFQDDCNSTMCADTKKTLTRKGIKKQIRYLNKPLYELYVDFVKSHGSSISKATFYKLKPFWIVTPRVSARDTCLCTKHANIGLIIGKLHYLKVVDFKTEDQMLNLLTCDPRTEDCLARNCVNCKGKELTFRFIETEENSTTKYYQWVSKKEDRISAKTKKPITVQINIKDEFECTVAELSGKLKDLSPDFLHHCLNITHQYVSVKNLKMLLDKNQLLIHVDFAENWNCKYNQEIQSMHFGASRNQISLHTGVLYSEGAKAEAFCSVSESTRHDPVAIFAHLKPILTFYLEKYPEVDVLHFQSDGPSTQYKNKTMFGIIATTIPDHFLQIKEITWNFSESGHGKGGPDGVGAGIKRKADSIVAHFDDISNFDSFCKQLISYQNQNNDKIQMKIVENIESYDDVCFKHGQAVKGHRKIHQVTWAKQKCTSLFYNTLSCFMCKAGTKCSHYFLGMQTVKRTEECEDLNETSTEDPPLNLNEADRPYDNRSEGEAGISKDLGNLACDQWIAVHYPDAWYPGVVKKITKMFVTVSFMERAEGNGCFQWPLKSESYRVKRHSIIGRLLQAPQKVSESMYHIACSHLLDELV